MDCAVIAAIACNRAMSCTDSGSRALLRSGRGCVMIRVRLILLAIIVCSLVGSDAIGQSSSGSYTLSNGCRVNWSVEVGFGQVVRFQRKIEVIEGADQELQEIGGEGAPIEEGQREYTMLDLARDLMRQKYSEHWPGFESDEEQLALPEYSRKSVVESAIGAYGMHLEEFPEDWIVVREMAVALLEAGRLDDSIQVMHEAYLKDPEMGILPIQGELLGEVSEPMRQMVVRAVRYAHKKPSAEAWLLVGVLMQSQGRFEPAERMLERAIGLGLESEIADGLLVALP